MMLCMICGDEEGEGPLFVCTPCIVMRNDIDPVTVEEIADLIEEGEQP